MSFLGGLATEVAGLLDEPPRPSAQSVRERRSKDEADLYTFAHRESLDDPSISSEDVAEHVAPKPQLLKLSDLIVQGPGGGETFADRIAKCAFV